MALLHLTEHLAYGYHAGTFIDGRAGRAPGWRHVVVLLLAALVVIAWAGAASAGCEIRRRAEVSEALWLRRGRLALAAQPGPGGAVDRHRRDGRLARP